MPAQYSLHQNEQKFHQEGYYEPPYDYLSNQYFGQKIENSNYNGQEYLQDGYCYYNTNQYQQPSQIQPQKQLCKSSFEENEYGEQQYIDEVQGNDSMQIPQVQGNGYYSFMKKYDDMTPITATDDGTPITTIGKNSTLSVKIKDRCFANYQTK